MDSTWFKELIWEMLRLSMAGPPASPIWVSSSNHLEPLFMVNAGESPREMLAASVRKPTSRPELRSINPTSKDAPICRVGLKRTCLDAINLVAENFFLDFTRLLLRSIAVSRITLIGISLDARTRGRCPEIRITTTLKTAIGITSQRLIENLILSGSSMDKIQNAPMLLGHLHPSRINTDRPGNWRYILRT